MSAAINRLIDGVEIPMRDGVRLRADLWLPAGEGPFPVLLQRTPYRRQDVHGAQYIAALEFQSALRRGYAVAVQDTRGRYESEGAFDPFTHEGRDGADTVAWLRAQDFCDGRVAMFGCSYVGATQVLAAAEDPEGLVAISAHLTTARHGETWSYRGGAAELAFLILWIIDALGPEDFGRRLADLPAATQARGRELLARWAADPATAFARLPVLDDDLTLLAPYAPIWFDAARAAAAAGNRERLDDLGRSRVRMLVTPGWNDLFAEGALELFQTARARGAGHDRLIVGPWSHGNPKDWQGAFWHGPGASTAGLSDEQLDFFAAAFAGAEPASPRVRYFRSGSNSWHAAPDWPLPAATDRILHLDGESLADVAPGARWSRGYTADPLDPVPTTGGATFLPGLLLGRNSGMIDQAAVEARADLLCFTSAPLPDALEVTGTVRLILTVASDAPTADWTARLCEVNAQGISYGLVDGIRRWTNPGGEDEVEITLGSISHLFAAGSRLRLQVASSNFPRFDRNPQTGADPMTARAGDMARARQSILGGGGRAARLILPIIAESYPKAATFSGL